MKIEVLTKWVAAIFALFVVVEGFDKFDQMRLDAVKFDKDACSQTVKAGRDVIKKASQMISKQHLQKKEQTLLRLHQRHANLLEAGTARHKVFSLAEDGDAAATCSTPMVTIFPTPTTTVPTTVFTGSTTSDNDTESSTTPTPANSAAPESEQFEVYQEEQQEEPFQPRPMFINTEDDPFVKLMTYFHNSLDEEGFCNGPKPKDFFSISDEQIHGTLSSFLTTSGTYLCPICHGFASQLHLGLLHKQKLSMADDEKFMYETALAHVPGPQEMCSTIIPSCHEDYETKKSKITGALDCIHCTVCKTFTIITLQKILNNDNKNYWRQAVNDNVFSNICAEICILGQTAQNQTFNYGDEKACQAFLGRQFDWIYDLLQRFLMPNNFCAYELGVCELNESPNLIHCVKLLCEEALSHPLNIICPLIPDEPDDIQRFLNIQKPPMTTATWKKSRGEL